MYPQATVHVLPNGLKLVFVPDDHVESAAFGLFVASGSRHEPERLAGISHFIEHMLFKGTARRGARDISREIEGCGGSCNAFTGEQSTCFFAHMPCERLDVAIDVVCDMYLHPAFAPDEFERERQVVVQEIMMYRDDPSDVVGENLSVALFPRNRVGAPVAGTPEALARMTPRTLRDYVRRCYVPEGTVAVVVGSFDPARALKAVSRRLGRLRGGRRPAFARFDNRTAPVREVRVERDVNQVQLAVGYRIPFGAADPRRYALAALDAVFGATMSSRLFERIRERLGLSYDIRSASQLFNETGAYAVTAGLDPGRAGRAYRAILREIDRIRSARPSAGELARAKEYLLGHHRIAFERTTTRLFYYGSAMLQHGRVVPPEEGVRAIAAVTAADVLAVARDVFNDSRRAVSWVLPRSAALAPAGKGARK